jgi:hypothetical protein
LQRELSGSGKSDHDFDDDYKDYVDDDEDDDADEPDDWAPRAP